MPLIVVLNMRSFLSFCVFLVSIAIIESYNLRKIAFESRRFEIPSTKKSNNRASDVLLNRRYLQPYDVSSTRYYPSMADPDAPPEVDPTRKDPDENPEPSSPIRLPMVDVGGTKMDVNSRLLKDRIIMIGKGVDDNLANIVVAQLLYLANEDPNADITMYINSPGGSISSGMAIFDTMQFIPCDVSTICFGMAASMGAFLLAAGTKGNE